MPAEHPAAVDPALLDHLHEQLRHHDPATHPLRHATLRFHLGSTLLAGGDPTGGAEHLRAAAEGFGAVGLDPEHGKARNMLGVALRELGRPAAAAEAFTSAEGLLAGEAHALERAAAAHNHGLVARDLGDEAAAAEAFARALEVFERADARRQAASCARELGACQLAAGHLDRARASLEHAQQLARRAGDRAGLGAAANVRGVVELASDRPDAATAAFLDAVGAHPRAVRPADHALARANLALAHERGGRADHARLAARQALAVPELPPVARTQAQEVLVRLGPGERPLAAVLLSADAGTDSDAGERVGVLRAELGRIAAGPDGTGEPEAHAREVVAALAEPAARAACAAAWLEVVLEQPPQLFAALLEGLVVAVEELDTPLRDAVAGEVSRAMVGFHVPQWMRLRDTVAQVAARRGARARWA